MGSAAALVLWVGGPNNFLAEAIFFETSVRERERERERDFLWEFIKKETIWVTILIIFGVHLDRTYFVGIEN